MFQSLEATAVEEVWDQIGVWSRERESFADAWEYEEWLETMVNAAKARFPFMQKATTDQYISYRIQQKADENTKAAADRFISNLKEQDFWDAVYEFDPRGPGQPQTSQLERIYESGQLQTLTLGKIYGKTTLKLLPRQGALPTTENPCFIAPFDYAVTVGGAVSYPDGHPSEEMAIPNLKGYTSPSKLEAGVLPTIREDDDDTLRRFVSLGYVLQQSQSTMGAWEKTGHVLVADMGDRRVRHRDPWLVLASEWPTDGEETAEGDFYYRAKEHVLRNASVEPGVFPGDHNRTPITPILPMNDKDKRPIIKQFGPNFLFKPDRRGGRYKSNMSTQYGPSLVHVMDWYWDPKAEQQVCYTQQGLEYLRYDPQSMKYSFPDFSKMSFQGEHGLFGDLEPTTAASSPRFIPREERMDQLSLEDAPTFAHNRLTSSVSGF